MKSLHIISGIVIFVFGCIVIVCLHWKQDFTLERESTSLRRMVRSLSEQQTRNEAASSRMQIESESVVREKFPWLIKNNTLPNYFLTTRTHRERYTEGNIAFLQYPRAAGSAMLNCLKEISKKKHIAMSPVMSVKHRLLWENEEDNLNKFRHRLKLHAGKYVFGACEKLNDTCSYFLILRDPLKQAVSSYDFCKSDVDHDDDDMCQGFNANSMTLRDWILNQGSVFLRQIMFHAEACTDNSAYLNVSLPTEFLFTNNVFPCWLKQKLFLEQFSQLTLTRVVNYIINNLQEWFAVIGSLDELTDALVMFEKVYKLPFTKCKHFANHSPVIFNDLPTDSNSARSLNKHREELYEDNELFSLSEDPFIIEALSADYRIYNAALKLFHVQKQTFSNKIV